MAFIHGKGTSISVDSVDLSAFTDNVSYKRAIDSHDVSTFGATGHKYQGGLTDGTITLTGTYDDGSSTPKTTLEAAMDGGVEVAFVYEEQVASGKAKTTGNVLVTAYEETAPVADMIKWSATLQLSGTMTVGTQS
jgi:hypothetical protein